MSDELARETNTQKQPDGAKVNRSLKQDASSPELDPLMAEPSQFSSIYNKTYRMMEKISATYVGQYLLQRIDLMLNTFEETAKWSLPADHPDFYLIRPLPWVPFLLLIVALRLLLMYLSIGALLLGDEPVTAKKFIYFIQTRRRKLRFIRMQGIKEIQQRESERGSKTVMARLGKLLSNIACRPQSFDDEVKAVAMTRDSHVVKETNQLTTDKVETSHNSKCQRIDGSPYVSCIELLSKYANQDTDEDSDYIPAHEEEEESINDESLTSSTSVDNASDQSVNEKDSSDTIKRSPKREKMPNIGVKSPNNSTSKNSEDYDNEETISAESRKSFTMSPHTPIDNAGGASNCRLGMAVEVAKTQETEKPQNPTYINLLNGHSEVQKKATPGHESAAETKPPSFLDNIINANANPNNQKVISTNTTTPIPTPIPTLTTTPTTTGPMTTANVSATPPNPNPTPSTSSKPSPSCSTASSDSSLASFKTSDDIVSDDSRSDPPTPTPSLNTASSTEELYQSPFGSPAEFSAFTQTLTQMQNPFSDSSGTQASPNGHHSSSGADEELSQSKHFKPDSEQKSIHKPQQHQQKNHQQRYRNRNRR